MEESFEDTISQAKLLIGKRRFGECEALLSTAMLRAPHAAIPHNLMGLMLEKKGEHPNAMKHFRAAWALDPTYRPASWNLDCYGSYLRTRQGAYSECECDAMAGEQR